MSADDDTPRVTTTHAGPGDGRPRLILSVAGAESSTRPGSGETFELPTGPTVIGSGPESEIRLDGLDSVHAEIHHTEQDEYVLILHGEGRASFYENTSLPGGQTGHVLRTGYRFEIGPHQLSFMRDEYADHGRPYGGRQGGEFSVQHQQGPRPGQDATERDLSYEVEQSAQNTESSPDQS